MKKLIFVSAVSASMIFLLSCAKQPRASFTPNKTSGYEDENIQFINNSEEAQSYEWTFGDGTNSTEKNPAHAYANAGSYLVTLKAFSKKERKLDDVSIMITISARQPEASFTINKTLPVIGDPITFNNTSKYASSYEWIFGDGSTSNVMGPIHTYTSAGTYPVTMVAYSKDKTKSSATSSLITVSTSSSSSSNYFQYNGSKNDLTQGFLEYYGNWNGDEVYFNYDIILLDNGITYTKDTVTGKGNIVYVELWSSSPSFLPNGTYNFSTLHEPYALTSAGLLLNFDVANSTGTVVNAIMGNVTLSKSGSVYTIDGTFQMENGKTMTTHFQGPLTFFDYTVPSVKVRSGSNSHTHKSGFSTLRN